MNSPPAFDPADAAWLAHRYEPVRDELLYRHVPRPLHSEGPFLTDELVGAQPQAVIPRAEGVAAAEGVQAPVHFIFHSAFCASTLLARAFDRRGTAMSLSEPVLLNDIVGIRRRGEKSGAELAKLIDQSVALLARRWHADEAVVIKPSNILAGLQPAILALRPDAQALLLFAPLPAFLLSVARKGLWCRLWARELLEGLLREGLVNLGFEQKDYFRLSDLQVAAVGWLVQHQLFQTLATRFPDRVRSLDSEKLLADPAPAIEAVGSLFHFADPASLARDIVAGPAFTRHSKSGAAYSMEARAAERTAAINAHGEEIEKVHQWAVAVARNAGISLEISRPLIE